MLVSSFPAPIPMTNAALINNRSNSQEDQHILSHIQRPAPLVYLAQQPQPRHLQWETSSDRDVDELTSLYQQHALTTAYLMNRQAQAGIQPQQQQAAPVYGYPSAASLYVPAGAVPVPARKPLRNLHVDNLPPVTEASLRALFSPFGRIARVRVVTDTQTGAHAGYGFVMFEQEIDTQTAMTEMDGRLVWSDQPWEGNEEEPHNGNNQNTQRQMDPNNNGESNIQQTEDGEIEEEEGDETHGHNNTSTDLASSSAASTASGVSPSVSDENTATTNTSDGSTVPIVSPSSGDSPQVPFVPPPGSIHNPDGTYLLPSGILLSSTGCIGKRLRVTLARHKKRGGSGGGHIDFSLPINTNLYIAGLPLHYLKPQLDAMFAPFGLIQESRILLDRATGNSRGVGFVRYDNQQSCNAAIRSWNGRQPKDATSTITVRYATDKNSAMAVAAAQQAQAQAQQQQQQQQQQAHQQQHVQQQQAQQQAQVLHAQRQAALNMSAVNSYAGYAPTPMMNTALPTQYDLSIMMQPVPGHHSPISPIPHQSVSPPHSPLHSMVPMSMMSYPAFFAHAPLSPPSSPLPSEYMNPYATPMMHTAQYSPPHPYHTRMPTLNTTPPPQQQHPITIHPSQGIQHEHDPNAGKITDITDTHSG